MCLALIDGRAWTVGELARTAGIAPSTASEHVARLRDAGLVELVRQGRHHYARIADHTVAELVERLAAHAKKSTPRSCAHPSAPAGSPTPEPATTTSPEHSAWPSVTA
ncbi:hypothetical protein GTS_02000 [Gandjariella thermophila]|uniref:HTH arsR-type domain-containing protein n=1 Tax=Gandjariella thermophila TaxID=1931992 RepID=A0A4D4J3J9_9PSEU|nr:hypothetical protein GTS_02000 [Gandjariella thermophila]